jgi:hypothetical protein
MTEKRLQGFACLSPERRKEIASLGGSSVAPENRAYSRDPDLARRAGLKRAQTPRPSKPKPVPVLTEIWNGVLIAQIMRCARAGKTMTETRKEVRSELSVADFKAKCMLLQIVFKRQRVRRK